MSITAVRIDTATSDLVSDEDQAAFTERIQGLPDDRIVSLISSEIITESIVTGFRTDDGRHHRALRLLYVETVRRGDTGLYARGYDHACR